MLRESAIFSEFLITANCKEGGVRRLHVSICSDYEIHPIQLLRLCVFVVVLCGILLACVGAVDRVVWLQLLSFKFSSTSYQN